MNAETGHTPVNILLVDDQPGKLMSYELILGELGENLLKSSSGKEALEVLLRNDVAVILADVCMPDMDGFELAKMIREHPRFKETAIIFISAIQISDGDSLKGYELGGFDYVPVPVVPEVLRAKVRVFVDLYRKTQALARMNDELEKRVADRTSELEAAIQRQELLAREVDHRARNALTVIQAIVSLTRASDGTEFASAIKGRIRAMATAHNLLSESRWRGADLLRLMDEELAPYAQHDRVAVSGPAVAIMPTAAQNLALALHELATNAAKYGALSTVDGKLSVAWRLEENDLVLEWIEACTHPIEKPKRQGFGSRVVESSVKAQLSGVLEQEWGKRGLRCVMRLPRKHFAIAINGARDAAHEAHKNDLDLSGIRNRRIMVLEDEPLVAMMVSQIVSRLEGVVLGPYSTAREAMAAVQPDIDAALLDVNIGGEFVYPLAEELTRRGVPIMFVTGYQASAIDPRFANAPVLTKPIEADDLAQALASVLPAPALVAAHTA